MTPTVTLHISLEALASLSGTLGPSSTTIAANKTLALRNRFVSNCFSDPKYFLSRYIFFGHKLRWGQS